MPPTDARSRLTTALADRHRIERELGAGHHPPMEMRVPPINAFLDRVLGPVASAPAR